MDFVSAVKTCLKKYAVFTGRAGRPEFWWFALFNFGAHIVSQILDRIFFRGHMMFSGMNGAAMDIPYTRPVFGGLLSLALLLPALAVGSRRMHDIGRSGWWQAIGLAGVVAMIIPILGIIVALACMVLLIYWFAQPSAGPNSYGTGPEPALA